MPERGSGHTPVLEGARVRLRELRLSDRDALYAIFSDPRVTRYWSFAAWTDLAQALAFIDVRLSLSGSLRSWAIARCSDDVLIGTMSLFPLHGPTARGEIGYALAPALQGQGLATEALQLALDFAFAAGQLHCIEADVDPRNEASVRLLLRAGFVRDRVEHGRWRVGDEFADSEIYTLQRP